MTNTKHLQELAARFRSDAISWKDRWTTIEELRHGAQAAAKKARRADGMIGFLKVLNKQRDEERRVRMYHEIVSIQRLHGPGVPALIETNAHHYNDPRYKPYVAMEFIDGARLGDLVPNNRISPQSAVTITLELCRILKRAHAVRVYHRDIKPDNIMLVGSDTGPIAYLVDFGIAHVGQSDAEFETEAEQTIGNSFLALPEFRGGFKDKNNPGSDITLCVGILFFMLTKANPVVLLDSNGLLPHQRPIERAALLASGLARDRLLTLFDRGFRYEITSRFQNVDGLVAALNHILRTQPAHANDKITIETIRERLDAASEEEKRNRMAALNATLIQATNVVHATVSALQGRIVPAQANSIVTDKRATRMDGFHLATDSKKSFMPTFEVVPVGNEAILTVKGTGVPRIVVRSQFFKQFDDEGVERIKQFLLAGLDLITNPTAGEILAKNANTAKEFAAKAAGRMVEVMVTAVSSYIENSGGTLTIEEPARGAKGGIYETNVLAQDWILARLTDLDKYVRFNVFARVEIPNHPDETETEAAQQIEATIMEGKSGDGPSASIKHPRDSFLPLRPSHKQIDDLVKSAVSQLNQPG
jgi:serine/threonine protein kinase